MEEVVKFLKACQPFYLATVGEDGQPHVRPIGCVCVFEDKLYIITSNQKKVYAQMLKNPKIEISGMAHDKWIRLEAEAYHDARREARVAMMDDNYAKLSSRYTVDDGLMEVLYLKNVTVAICSFVTEPEIYKF